MSEVIRPAAAILLSRGPKVWLGKRGRTRFLPGFWAFPGGRTEKGESAQQSAYRELEEETGLHLSCPLAPYARAITPPFSPIRYDLFVFQAELSIEQEPVADGSEFVEGGWFSFPEVLSLRSTGELQLAPPTFAQLQAYNRIQSRELAFPSEEEAFALPTEGDDMVMEMTKGITIIPLRSHTIPPAGWTNSLIVGEKHLFIVDPGGEEPYILQKELAKRTSLGAKIKGIVLTHHHPDHLAGYLKLGLTHLPLYCHPLTAELLPQEFPQTRAWNDKEVIKVESDLTMLAHLTPGHAPGHLAIEFPERKTLLAGDLISSLSSIVIPTSNGNLITYLDSLKKMRSLDCHLVIPSHGPPFGRGSDPFGLSIAHRQKREGLLMKFLAGENHSLTLEAISSVLYRGLDPDLMPAAQANTWHHLQKLKKEGKVSYSDDGWAIRKQDL